MKGLDGKEEDWRTLTVGRKLGRGMVLEEGNMRKEGRLSVPGFFACEGVRGMERREQGRE